MQRREKGGWLRSTTPLSTEQPSCEADYREDYSCVRPAPQNTVTCRSAQYCTELLFYGWFQLLFYTFVIRLAYFEAFILLNSEIPDESGTWTSISKEQDFLSAYDLQSVYGENIDSIFARCGGCYESDIAGGV